MKLTRLPPIQCLVTFDTLAKLRSVSQTSEALCVTVSAVSHRMRQLEDHLGVKLFTKEFQLTSDGVTYLQHVRAGLVALQQLSGEHRLARRTRLRLAAPPTFCRTILMPKLAIFRTTYPDIDFDLNIAIPMIDTAPEPGEFQIRFGRGGYSDCESRLLQQDVLTPACSPGFLSEFGPFDGFTSTSELTQTRLIRSPLEPWAPWFQHCGHQLAEPTGSQFNDIGLAYDAAASGFGVMLVRHKIGATWLDSGRLVKLADHAVPSPHSYYLCWNAGSLERWECAVFAEWLLAAVAV